MIIETIVATLNADGSTHLSPMGPHVRDDWEQRPSGDPAMTLRPFAGSTTHANLMRDRRAIIHLTDEAELFVRGVIGDWPPGDIERRTTTIGVPGPRRLIRCQRWFAVEVVAIHGTEERPVLSCQVIASDIGDPQSGLNRGVAAVVEAAIVYSRWHLLPASELDAAMGRCRTAVEKTGSPETIASMEMLSEAVRRRRAAI